MSEEEKKEVIKATEVKPFWKSTSFWLAMLTVVGVLLDKLVAEGVIPDEGWAAIVVTVVGLIAKRGSTENASIKAKALATMAPKDPQ